MTDGKQKGVVRLYACGGTAINIASLLVKHDSKELPGFANLDVCFVDTSRASLMTTDVSAEKAYVMDGMDGSGGLRSENAQAVSERVLDILQQFKPGDLNIVLSSGGGGSGSVISPLVCDELLAREVPVIAIIVGSVETRKDAENTLKTFMTYDNFTKKHGVPLAIYYVQNDREHGHLENDKSVTAAITTLRALFSRENGGMDTMDTFNWLRFDKVTSYKNMLASLTLFDKNSDLSKAKNVISVATLANDAASAALPFFAEYQRKGLVQTSLSKQTENLPLHFVISDGFLSEHVTAIETLLNNQDEAVAARHGKKSLFTRDKGPESVGGLIL